MTPDGENAAGATTRPAFGLLLLAAAAVLIWFACLALLAFLTANPVTLNREQILRSDAIVVARADGPTDGGIGLRIKRVLGRQPGVEVPSEIVAAGTEPARFRPETAYLVPLTFADDRWTVTPAPAAYNSVPLIYPATGEALAAAERILATEAARPYK